MYGQITGIRASAGNKRSNAQGRFRNTGKIICRKKKTILLGIAEKELRDARLFRLRIWSQKSVFELLNAASTVGRQRYILSCCEAGKAYVFLVPAVFGTS